MSERIEPLSRASLLRRRQGLDPPFAECHAYRELKKEIQSYCTGRVGGRAILVAGHRGCGKTTIIYRAIEDILLSYKPSAEDLADRGRVTARPLLVRLHGPDIIGRLAAGEEGVEKSVALREMTRALHRSLAEELAGSFTGRIQELAREGEHLPRQLHEMAGQFLWYLDHWPDLATLRSFYERAGFLGHGVLFAASQAPAEQGMRELLAVNTAIELERAIHDEEHSEGESKGNATDDVRKEGDTHPGEHSKAGEPSAVTLFRQLRRALGRTQNVTTVGFSLLAAAIVIGLVLSISHSPVMAVVGGVVVSLVTGTVLAYLSPQSQDQSLLADMSPQSFDRTLPLLVNRVFDAGLAPIFVVDELDKLSVPFEQINDLVRKTKHVISGQCFFCFVTDRQYHTQLKTALAIDSYATPSTFFAKRLLVYYLPEDVDKYLDQRLSGKDWVGVLNEWRKVLKQRSRLHLGDLERAISQDELPDLNDPGTRKYIDTLTVMQDAVEKLLGAQSARARIDRDPDFGQVMIDALYHPSWQWHTLKDLHLSLYRVAEYLQSQAGYDPHSPTSFLPDQSSRFIWTQLRDMMPSLEQAKIVSRSAVDAWRWNIDDYGRPVRRETEQTEHVIASIASADLFFDLALMFEQYSGDNLCEVLALFLERPEPDLSVAWHSAAESLARLRRHLIEPASLPDREVEGRLMEVDNFVLRLRTRPYEYLCGLLLISHRTSRENTGNALKEDIANLRRYSPSQATEYVMMKADEWQRTLPADLQFYAHQTFVNARDHIKALRYFQSLWRRMPRN